MQDNFQVYCSQIPDETELNRIPPDINFFIINCDSPVKYDRLFNFQIFPNLIFVSINHCNVQKIPSSTFQNIPEVREVHLAELNISSLPPEMFKNSTNMRRLSLIQMSKLSKISPFVLAYCPKLEEINLGGLNVSTNLIQPFLLVVLNSLRKLSWNNNLYKLEFDLNYFKYFKFKELKLLRNKIDDLEFLQNIQSQEVYLDFNEIGIYFYIEKYKYLIEDTLVLSVEQNVIHGLFPSDNEESRTKIEKLFLNNNKITGFSKLFHRIFPKLVYLDASDNNIVTLADFMQHIPTLESVLLSRNPIFCGCEFNWVLKYKTIIRTSCPRSMVIDNSTSMIAVMIYKDLANITRFPCTSPRTYLEIYQRKDLYRSKQKELTMELYPCEFFQVRCISKGDPQPELELINLNEPALLKSTLKYEDEITVSTPLLFISHSQLSPDPKYNRLYCTGTNSHGKDMISLQLNKMSGKRHSRKPFFGVEKSRRCQQRNSSKVATHVFIVKFLCLITFYYLF